jgi:hypothetical protein
MAQSLSFEIDLQYVDGKLGIVGGTPEDEAAANESTAQMGKTRQHDFPAALTNRPIDHSTN